MANDFTTRYGVAWRNTNSPRTLVHGLVRIPDGVLRHSPPLKNMAWYANGSIADNWPVTANFTYQPSSGSYHWIHPMLDPNYGICVYGYNIFGTGITSNDLAVIPTGFSVMTQQGPTIGVQNSVAFWNDSYGSFWTMPSTLNTDKIRGQLYGYLDGKIHLRNNLGTVDNDKSSRLQSSTGKFPYYLIDANAFVSGLSYLSGRNQITPQPSCFAVVACTLCTPVGIGLNLLYTQATDVIYPRLEINSDTSQVNYVIYSSGTSSGGTIIKVNPWVQTSTSKRTNVVKIHDNGTTAVYFVWMAPAGSESLYSSTTPAYVMPPIIKCTPNSGWNTQGAVVYCRILQYGVQWNI